MNKKTKLFFFLLFFLFSLFSFFRPVLAQERELEIEYPEIFGIKPEYVSVGLPKYVKYVFNFSVAIFGVIVFGALIYGGFLYLTSVGEPAKIAEARDQISSAFLGLIILLSSYIIFTTINPELLIFHLPPLKEIEKKEVQLPSPAEAATTSLIATELPLGQAIEELFGEIGKKETNQFLAKIESSLLQYLIKPENIFDLNKYLESLSTSCKCNEVNVRSYAPKDFAFYVGLEGDVCPEKERKEINNIVKVNNLKVKDFLDISKEIAKKRENWQKKLENLSKIEQEMLACQTKGLEILKDFLITQDYFSQKGWRLELVRRKEYPPFKEDPLTFYCSVGGNLTDYPYLQTSEIPVEEIEKWAITETPETGGEVKYTCNAEYPVGAATDEAREKASEISINFKRLATLFGELASTTQIMNYLVEACNSKNCQGTNVCVPNPCYGGKCGIICVFFPPFCTSPCFQGLGGASGQACPREEISTIVKVFGEIKKEISETINKIETAFGKANYILFGGGRLNLDNLRNEISKCYSKYDPETEKPTWELLNCRDIIGDYYSDPFYGYLLIKNCHPRNYFCCLLPEKPEKLPEKVPEYKPYYLAQETYIPIDDKDKETEYQPLEAINNCPMGWNCQYDVTYYNQYNNDASEPLKKFISCLKKELDKIKEERGIKEAIGEISSISDKALYLGTCNWGTGPSKPPCSHTYDKETVYGESVSCHYGGKLCCSQKKSYAIDLADEKNYKYFETVAKKCHPYSFINYEGNHVHISIGRAEGCGCD